MKFPAARWALVRSPRPDPRPGPGVPPSRSLRTLALTPERIPRFHIPSPAHPARRPSAGSPDDNPGASLGATRRRSGDADTDESTRAAMSLPHVGKVTTPYGFRAVLESSPCCPRKRTRILKPESSAPTARGSRFTPR
ncbi:unnamed protein product [Arctogadus glacialis]